MTPTATLRRQLRRLRQARLCWKLRVAAKQQLIRQLRVSVRDLGTSRDRWKQRYQLLRQQLLTAPATPPLLPWPAPVAAEELLLGEE